MDKPLERLTELRDKLGEVDFRFDCTDALNVLLSQFRQGQIIGEATIIAVEAQASQADSLARIADHLEVIAHWCKNVKA